jgi:hypothetical protein
MKLSLQQPIQYTRNLPLQVGSCSEAFDRLHALLKDLPLGAEACIVCEAIMTDDLCRIEYIQSVYTEPEEKDVRILSIPAGTYLFEQLRFPPSNGAGLIPLLNRFATSSLNSIDHRQQLFVRLYKEGPFAIVVQILAPLTHTIGE